VSRGRTVALSFPLLAAMALLATTALRLDRAEANYLRFKATGAREALMRAEALVPEEELYPVRLSALLRKDASATGLSLAREIAKLEEALAEIERAVALNPAHAESHFYRGEILGELGRRAEAEKSLRTAERLGPLIENLRRRVGEYSLARWEVTRSRSYLQCAQESFEAANSILPGPSLFSRLLAEPLVDEESLRLALGPSPDEKALLARFLLQHGKAAPAIELLREAGPRHRAALAQALLDQDREEEAFRILLDDAAIARRILAGKGRESLRARYWLERLKRAPGDPAIAREVAEILVAGGQAPEAFELLKDFPGKDTSPVILRLLAKAARAMNRESLARIYEERAARLERRKP
jgi:tetratricopeptide (TPR) repeat protein